ncbi:MAG: chemotaxis protein CheX [Nitrospiraceae bacterium]|nr:MAG: chemotaxis protein CheX [Nitrospiraceae bacterium]
MNTDFINPFLESIINVLTTMAGTEAKPGRPFLKTEKSAKGDVTGIIGLMGEKAKGSLAITFTEPAILHIASKMLGEEIQQVDGSVADCVGEITNMVTGGAKKILSEKGYKFDMAIPAAIIGKHHIISHKTDGRIICIPFETPAGSFFVEVCFSE